MAHLGAVERLHSETLAFDPLWCSYAWAGARGMRGAMLKTLRFTGKLQGKLIKKSCKFAFLVLILLASLIKF